MNTPTTNPPLSDAEAKQSGADLFPVASFTVGDGYGDNQYCHAWGYEKAKEQLRVIIGGRNV